MQPHIYDTQLYIFHYYTEEVLEPIGRILKRSKLIREQIHHFTLYPEEKPVGNYFRSHTFNTIYYLL